MWAVEMILEHKEDHRTEQILYLVKWMNYADSESTWEDEFAFKGGEALVIANMTDFLFLFPGDVEGISTCPRH